MIFPVDHLASEWAAILAALPAYPARELGALKLSQGRGQAGRTERWYNPKLGRLLYAKTSLTVAYPSLEQSDGQNRTMWMSGAQDECLAMKSMARRAAGNVLIGGLGLGILAWLCASKPLVKSVTVIELNPDVIAMVRPVVNHPKIAVEQGDIKEYLARTADRYDFIGLDTWPDAGRAVLESPRAKDYARRALARNGIVRTWLDEIADRLIQSNALDQAAQAARKTRGKMLDYPQMTGNRACDFCGANPFIDCYGFCVECFYGTGICAAAGDAILAKAERLQARAATGELDYLAAPYPELYEYLVSQRIGKE